MKKYIKYSLMVLIVSALLTGCSSATTSESSSNINFVDAGDFVTTSDTSASSVPTDTVAPDTSVTTSASTEDTTDTREPQSTTTRSSATTAAPQEIYIPDETIESEESSAPSTSEQSTSQSSEPSTTPQQTIDSTTISEEIQTPVEAPSDFGVNTYVTLNHSEVQGIWISYLEYLEMMQGKSESQFRSNIAQALDNCLDLGLNTVFVHARSHGDAFYESELFPWSKYASGSIDTDPGFDPLEVIIDEAHSRGISVQAWINPLRLCSTSDMSSYGDFIVSDWYNDSSFNGSYIVEVNGYYYLNPAYDEVIELVSDGVCEIISQYDVDGLHIDDYFYPTTDTTFDAEAFNESSYSDLSDFRFDNCDRLVSAIYDAVKTSNPTALFSVSCQGSIENNYDKMYADVEKWCTEDGYLDYIVPQIYYGFENSTQPYSECLSRWDAIASRGGIPLVVGLSVYKIGVEDVWAGAGKSEWINDSSILARQLAEAMECVSYGGAALYSYRSIYSADSSVSQQVWAEIEDYTEILE